MLIPLNEPSSFSYIRINPATDRVHLLVPLVAGVDISTDNTCKSDLELKTFFEGAALKELESYKSTLEFHLALIEEEDAHHKAKKERLDQINIYLKEVAGMRASYKHVVDTFLKKSSNLYSIQLRPQIQDSVSRVVNPVFTINRGNDSQGIPLSSLYNKMHEVFPALTLGKKDPRTDLIDNVLEKISKEATFDDIKRALKSQCAEQFKIDIDVESWIRPIPGSKKGVKEPVDKAHVDAFMGFSENASAKDYIEALLGICAPNLWRLMPGSPFYLGVYDNKADQTEKLSMMTQFYLGVLNVYCRAKDISDKNFGVILDGSPALSHELVDIFTQALHRGEEVESAIVAFFNKHKQVFDFTRDLTMNDRDAMVQKFETTWRTVTATKENPHMDDFMFLDTEAGGKNNICIANNGLICTDFSHIVHAESKNINYFAEISHEVRTDYKMVTPQDESVITVDITPESLMNKLDDVQLERLPKEVVDACCALPVFKVRKLLDNVAKGKQSEAKAILRSSDDIQLLLRTPCEFTDYSGRTFYCTAYEYAWWAKDTHMQRMLESHMDDESKRFLLGKVDEIEHLGLAYQQHGVAYKNSHYDMSFILKNLSVDEFHRLKTMVGPNNAKIQQATSDNYQNISFTATEYEVLKKILAQHRTKDNSSFFDRSDEEAISDKLQFDFHSLITALDIYVTNYETWDSHQREEGWMNVGKAQRYVPAHVAHEYCRPDRGLNIDEYKNKNKPRFKEITLPRILNFSRTCYTNANTNEWFPLVDLSSGLGFDFALKRGWFHLGAPALGAAPVGEGFCGVECALVNLAAVRHLDEARIADLAQSHENLIQRANKLEMAH